MLFDCVYHGWQTSVAVSWPRVLADDFRERRGKLSRKGLLLS